MPEERLDVRLSRETGMTRSRVETLIREGRAQVNGAVEKKPGRKVCETDAVSCDVPPPVAVEARPEDIPLQILYEDDDLAVVVSRAAWWCIPPRATRTARWSTRCCFI